MIQIINRADQRLPIGTVLDFAFSAAPPGWDRYIDTTTAVEEQPSEDWAKHLTTVAMRCWKISDEHGFHEGIDNDNLAPVFWEKLGLIISELAEAIEEFRDRRDWTDIYFVDGEPEGKAHGIPVELADAVIRIFDLFVIIGVDNPGEVILQKMRFNDSRPYRHGDKRA